jgi:glyceraldehyde 3-phosphate dehydrogenase
MSTKVLLNGAGRIGKAILKQLLENKEFEIITINEINPSIENIVYSINYDSTYGTLDDKFKVVENNFIQNRNSKIKITNFKNISELNLYNIDILIDSSGQKTNINELKSLNVKKVILTHPQKDADIKKR